VFARLDTGEFLVCLQNWLRSLHLSLKEQGIAIDGKTMRDRSTPARANRPCTS
jgi:hypothetical protein